ncbi:hypothetical protein JSQ81_01570 [Sporosarcina sp. Marseille-Q4063]|nr:hypothetical protein JSQ81_01570 [Sporosarcina sp. Marseille-Q4063]
MHKDYIFKGESSHWIGEYVFKGTEKWKEKNKRTTLSSESRYTLAIKYKGDLSELASVKNLSYFYQTSLGSGSGETLEFDESPNQILFTISGGGTTTMNKDEVIEVTVKWDSFEESFELRSTGK